MSKLTKRDWSSHAAYISPEYKSTVLRGVSKNLVEIDPELAELTDPAYGAEILGPLDHDLTKNGRVNGEPQGERILVTGRVLDEDGKPVPHTLVEVWQANAAGRFNHPNDARESRKLDPAFKGFARVGTGTSPDNSFRFDTIKPGASEAGKAPFISVIVFMRGLPNHAYTRLYFSDEAGANAKDTALNKVAAARRDTSTGTEYRFDIHM